MKYVHEIVGLFVLIFTFFLLSFSTEQKVVYLPVIVETTTVEPQNIMAPVVVLPKEMPKGSPIKLEKLEIKPENSSGFGYRINPMNKTERHFHTGIDLSCKKGTLVYSTATGVVVRVQRKKSGYGNNVVVKHTNESYQTLYAHLDKILVEPGDTVFRGYAVGTVGSTGWSTRPHLHYEVFLNGKRINPLKFIKEES